MTHRTTSVVALLAVAVLPACEPRGSDAAESVTVRDSAGVRIVSHDAPGTVDSVLGPPVLTIGRFGEPDYEFFRIATVLSQADRDIVVVNGGTSELRFFDSAGTYVRTVGGPGEGPAEFGFLSTAWLRPGESIAVHDPRRRRVVLFGPEGTFREGRSYASWLTSDDPPPGGLCAFPGLLGLLGDGRGVVSGWSCAEMRGSTGLRSISLPLGIHGDAGTDTLGTFDAARIWEDGDATNPRERYTPIPFGGGARFAIGEDRIFISEGSTYEIRVFRADGRPLSTLRETGPPPPVLTEDEERYRAERDSAGRPLASDVPFPDHFPGYETLLLSAEGDLWARRSARPQDRHHTWAVFSGDGARLRHVVLPADFDVESVRGGRIYGYSTNDMDVQTVVVYELPHRERGFQG